MKQKRYLHKRSIDKLPEFSEIKVFEKDFEDLKELCSLINKKSDKSTQALKNYIIIRLVGIVENELKAAAAWIIDEFKLRPRDLLDGDEITVSLTRLEEITGKNVTKGKVVITEYTLTNAKKIGELFSYINGVNTVDPRNKKRKRFNYKSPAEPFFVWIQELMQIPITPEADMYNFLDVILKERNEVVHYLKDVEDSFVCSRLRLKAAVQAVCRQAPCHRFNHASPAALRGSCSRTASGGCASGGCAARLCQRR